MKAGRFAAAALVVSAAGAFGGEGDFRPPEWFFTDPGKSFAMGKVALIADDGRSLEDCRLVVAEQSDMLNEVAAPCGQRWVEPPAYGSMLRMWLEGTDAMSPTPAQLSTGHSEPGVVMRTRTVPAGRVSLAGDPDERPGVSLKLLDAAPRTTRFGLPVDMFRELPPERWEEGALMPAGQAIGWLWDGRKEKVLALSEPFEVGPGDMAGIPLDRPAERSHLLAVLTRPKQGWSLQEEVSVVLRVAGAKRSPDLLVPTLYRVYAVFYDLPVPDAPPREAPPLPGEGPAAELLAETPTLLLPLQRIPLEKGNVELRRAELVDRPLLEVEVGLPAELRQERPALEASRLWDGEVVAKRKLAAGARRDVLGGLPADRLALKLSTSRGDFTRRIDLSDGLSATVRMAVLPLSGRAPFAAAEAAAGRPPKILLHAAGAEPQAAALDAAGAFAQLFLGPIEAVSVEPADGGPPLVAVFEEPLDEACVLDLRLTAEGLEVVAEPVAGPTVAP